MGLFDWIQQKMGKGSAEPVEAPAEAAAPAAPAPSEKKEKKRAAKAAKAARPPRVRPPKPPRKRKNKKKRKGMHVDPRMQKMAPAPVAAVVAPEPPVVVEAPVVEAPVEAAPVVEAVETPVETPVEAAPVEAAPSEAAARPISAGRHRSTTRDWVVIEKMDGVLAALDEILAQEGAPRKLLVSTRSRLEREWRSLLPVPSGEGRIKVGYDTRMASLSERIAAIPDPRQVQEEKNLAARRALIATAEGLMREPDMQKAINTARTLQKSWRESGRVSKEQHAALNAQWRAAMDAIYARRDVERGERLKKLEGLVVQSEMLAKTSDPVRAAEAMKGLQARWKATGSPRGEEADALWTRFRAAADLIFAARREAKATEEQGNLAARQAIIAEAEAKAAEGVEDAEDLIDRLHQRWKRIGHVPREQSDAQWRAFRAACDQLRSTPDIDPKLLGDGEDSLRFSPFAGLKN